MKTALSAFGYTEREVQFITLAATESGYLVSRQFDYFLGTSPGALTQAFVRRIVENDHARVSVHARNTHLYHLCARPLYAAIGQENNRNRRIRPAHEVRVRLMRLDYWLHNRSFPLLSSEKEKLDHFQTLGIPAEVLPSRRYVSPRGGSTIRHFLDKNPIFLRSDGSTCFAFISGDAPSGASFESFLSEYGKLFKRLSLFCVVYVTSVPELARQGERAFQGYIAAEEQTADEGAQSFFRLRELHESGRTGELSIQELKSLRTGLTRYRGEPFESLFRAWRADKSPKLKTLSGTFSTFQLPYSYDLFGDLAGPKYGRE